MKIVWKLQSPNLEAQQLYAKVVIETTSSGTILKMKRPTVLEVVRCIVFVAGVIHQSLARPSQRADICGYEVVHLYNSSQ